MFLTHVRRFRPQAVLTVAVGLITLAVTAAPLAAQTTRPATRPARARPEDTEVWTPEPPVVTPGPFVASPPPADAVVLFDGHTTDAWVRAGGNQPATWTVEDGTMKVDKRGGNIETRRRFTDYALHLEYLIPADIAGTGQGRGNSGCFLASTGGGDAGYELQILDSYRNKTYVNGMAGSLYKQAIPLANACRPPGEWSSYDVTWTAPRFDADGKRTEPAYATVRLNGVLVQDHVALRGPTVYVGTAVDKPYDAAPIKLQAHGDKSAPIRFRNIWVRPTAGPATRP